MKTASLFFVLGFSTGLLLGASFAAWALYTPVPRGPAKYAFTRSASPVPASVIDGSKKLFRIECISESEKDCPQATADPAMPSLSIPEPSSLGLCGIGLVAMWVGQRKEK